jgi:hypothetical protein
MHNKVFFSSRKFLFSKNKLRNCGLRNIRQKKGLGILKTKIILLKHEKLLIQASLSLRSN